MILVSQWKAIDYMVINTASSHGSSATSWAWLHLLSQRTRYNSINNDTRWKLEGDLYTRCIHIPLLYRRSSVICPTMHKIAINMLARQSPATQSPCAQNSIRNSCRSISLLVFYFASYTIYVLLVTGIMPYDAAPQLYVYMCIRMAHICKQLVASFSLAFVLFISCRCFVPRYERLFSLHPHIIEEEKSTFVQKLSMCFV